MKAESPLRHPVVHSAAWLICIDSHRRRPVECGLRISHTAARAPRSWLCLLAVLVCCMPSGNSADFKAELFGELSRISANIVTQDVAGGYVQINGVAKGLASKPVWDFGDGTVTGSWFPAAHTYQPPFSNYIVRVTGHFTDGTTNWMELLVRFAPPVIEPVALPSELAVTIPTSTVVLASHMPGYGFNPSLTYFDDSFFSANLSRSAIEYILSVAAVIQNDLVNRNVFPVDGAFRQCVLRDPTFGGMYSIWYSSPVAFGSGDYGFQGEPAYSSFFHEMGHNFTLNFPASCFYGGKIDGQANAIYSETLAQIFQHATAYELMNHGGDFGLPADVAFEIQQSARSSICIVRTAYGDYLASGTNFCSWNDPTTPEDETFDTFMALAYKFCAHAEISGHGYRVPAQRLSRMLEVFNEKLRERFDQEHDTPAADELRATLLVTALCYAFQSDLRPEFRELRFPVSDGIHDELMDLMIAGVLRPTLVSPYVEGSNFSFSVQTETGRSYAVESADDLTATNWTPVEGIDGDGSLRRCLIPMTKTTQRFFRVRQP